MEGLSVGVLWTAPLTSICGSGVRNRKTPQSAPVGSRRGRVRTSSTGVDGRIAFDVEIESGTAGSGIASFLACNGVVALHAHQSHVAVLRSASLEV